MNAPRLPIGDEARVEIIPLIDVVFLVLVAFIYASAFLSPRVGLPVDLPRASEAEAEQGSIVTVTIEHDGRLFVGERPISVAELPQALIAARQADGDTSLYVKADRQVRLDRLVRVIDIARGVGMKGLTIATRTNVQAPAAAP